MKDIHTHLAHVINVSDIPVLEAMLLASREIPRKIEIENIPEPEIITLPIRIIEGMETIVERGTATKKEFSLIASLVALMQESPVLRA